MEPTLDERDTVRKEYTNGEITVVWQPALCTHSKRCWKELWAVFKPMHRPWVDMQGAPTDRIVRQIERCPSGALTYYTNAGAKPADSTAL